MQNKFKSPIKKAQIGGMMLPDFSQLPVNLKKAAPRIAQIQREKSMLLPDITPLPTDFKGVVSMKPANENVQPTYAASQAEAFKDKIEKGDEAFDYYQHYMTKGNGDQMMGAILGNWIKSRRNKKEFNRLNEIDNKNRAEAEQRAKMQSAINKGLNVKRTEDATLVTKQFRDKNDKIKEVIIGDMNKPAIQTAVSKLDDKGNIPGTNVTPAQTIANKSEPAATYNPSTKRSSRSGSSSKFKSPVAKNNYNNVSGEVVDYLKSQGLEVNGENVDAVLNKKTPSVQKTAVDRLKEKTKYGFTPAPGYVPNQGVFGRTTPESEAGTRAVLGTTAGFAPFGKIFSGIKGLFSGASKAAPVIAKQAAKQLPAGNVVKQLPAGKPIRVAKDVYQKAANAAKSTSTAKPATQSVAKPVTKALPVGKTPSNVYGKPTPKSPNLPNMQPKRIPQNASPGSATTAKPQVNTTAAKAIPKKSEAAIQNTVAKFRSTIKSARATGDKAKVQKAMKEYQDFKNKYPAANKFQSGGSTNMRENLFNHYYNNM